MKFFQSTNKSLFFWIILGTAAVLYTGLKIWGAIISDINTGTIKKDISCVISGCSGQICAEEEMMSTCEFLPEYACYKSAVCERQADNKCGWTMTDELRSCLDNAKSRDFNNKFKVY